MANRNWFILVFAFFWNREVIFNTSAFIVKKRNCVRDVYEGHLNYIFEVLDLPAQNGYHIETDACLSPNECDDGFWEYRNTCKIEKNFIVCDFNSLYRKRQFFFFIHVYQVNVSQSKDFEKVYSSQLIRHDEFQKCNCLVTDKLFAKNIYNVHKRNGKAIFRYDNLLNTVNPSTLRYQFSLYTKEGLVKNLKYPDAYFNQYEIPLELGDLSACQVYRLKVTFKTDTCILVGQNLSQNLSLFYNPPGNSNDGSSDCDPPGRIPFGKHVKSFDDETTSIPSESPVMDVSTGGVKILIDENIIAIIVIIVTLFIAVIVAVTFKCLQLRQKARGNDSFTETHSSLISVREVEPIYEEIPSI